MAAVQARLTAPLPAAVAVRPDGAVGGVVSGTLGVVALTIDEYALRLPAASVARTRKRYAVLGDRPVLL